MKTRPFNTGIGVIIDDDTPASCELEEIVFTFLGTNGAICGDQDLMLLSQSSDDIKSALMYLLGKRDGSQEDLELLRKAKKIKIEGTLEDFILTF